MARASGSSLPGYGPCRSAAMLFERNATIVKDRYDKKQSILPIGQRHAPGIDVASGDLQRTLDRSPWPRVAHLHRRPSRATPPARCIANPRTGSAPTTAKFPSFVAPVVYAVGQALHVCLSEPCRSKERPSVGANLPANPWARTMPIRIGARSGNISSTRSGAAATPTSDFARRLMPNLALVAARSKAPDRDPSHSGLV